ncbi:MAG: hypothetical protein KDD42_03245 [Bdellovibrionales bacterium]|nr:hypothetical protein [Bdellovibrionales bacterium]
MLNSIKVLLRPIGLMDAMVAIALVSLLGVQLYGFARDPGVGWHLKTGQIVLESGSVPHLDPFLSHSEEREWVSDQWLSDLLLYWLYKVGSWPYLYCFFVVIFAFGYLYLLHRGVSEFGGSSLAAAIAVLLAFKLSQIHFLLRPVGLSFFFFTLVYVVLYGLYNSFRQRVDQRSLRRRILMAHLIFPLLFALWANMHPAFILGLFLIGMLTISVALDPYFFEGDELKSDRRALIQGLLTLFAASLAATWFNPYGLNLHASIFELGRSDFFMNLHMEWHSPDFKEFAGMLFQAALGLMVLGVVLGGIGRLRWGFFELGLVVGFAFLSMRSVRFLPFYGIAISIPLSQAIVNLKHSCFWERFSLLKNFPRYFGILEARERRTNRGALILGIGLLVVVLQTLRSGEIPFYEGEYGPPHKTYPYAALAQLDSIIGSNQQNVITIASTPSWGGFLAWHGYPRLKPLLDDRNTLVGETFYREFDSKMKAGGGWREYLDKMDADYLLLGASSPLGNSILECDVLPLLYRDDVAMLFKL